MLSAYRPMLLSLFESLHRLRSDPYGRAPDARAIQTTLIEQITAAEGRIQNVKQLAASLRQRLSNPQPVWPGGAEAEEVEEAIASHQEAIETDEQLLRVLRDVG